MKISIGTVLLLVLIFAFSACDGPLEQESGLYEDMTLSASPNPDFDSYCGDGGCSGIGETCRTCPEDCDPCPGVCGNDDCESSETCSWCPQDCGACPGTFNSGAENIYQSGTTVSTPPSWQEYGGFGGTFRVSEAGAATYSIPIQTAPSTGGLAPQISLVYNSQGGNGIMGMGWGVGGMSAISRCRATLETDGVHSNIEFNNNDQLCLDGQRLVLVPDGPSPDGGTNTREMYRKEIDDLTRVVVVTREDETDQPLGFKVESKDGTKRFYGNHYNSAPYAVAEAKEAYADASGQIQVRTTGKYQSWLLSKVEDRAGNSYSYFYGNDDPGGYGVGNPDEEYLLKSIRYSRSASHWYKAGLYFHYELRADRRTSYSLGNQSQINHRLVAISSKSDSNLQARYNFHYAPQTGSEPSRVEYIQKCGGDPDADVCLPPLKFEWLYPTDADSVSANYDLAWCTTASSANFDNDGKDDFVCMYNEGGPDNPHDWYKIGVSRWGSNWVEERVSIYQNKLDSWTMTDYNGDGKQDIVYLSEQSGDWIVNITDGPNLGTMVGAVTPTASGSYIPKNPSAADFDGDGLSDLFFKNKDNNPMVALLKRPGGVNDHQCADAEFVASNVTPFCYGRAKPVEVILDGEPVECAHDRIDCPRVPPSYGEPPEDCIPMDTCTDPDDLNSYGSGRAIDLNGDGFADSFAKADSGSGMSLRALISEWSENGELALREDPLMTDSLQDVNRESYMHYLRDLNGDGLTDILYSEPGCQNRSSCEWKVKINTGKRFVPLASNLGQTYGGRDHAEDIVIVDANGDGMLDILIPELDSYGSGLGFRVYSRSQSSGFSWTSQEIWIGTYHRSNKYLAMDTDADGSQEIVGVFINTEDHVRSFYSAHHLNDEFRPTVISAIEDVNGAGTELSYRTLTGDVYASDGGAGMYIWGAGSPVFDVVFPSYVVAGARSHMPTAHQVAPRNVNPYAKKEVRYRYENLRFQAGGRGNLGFEKVYTLDPDSHIETVTQYKQQFPHTGIPLKTEREYLGVPSATGNFDNLDRWGMFHGEPRILMSQSINTLNQIQSFFGGTMPFVETATESAWDLQDNLLTYSKIENEYDDYGNATKVTTWTGDFPGGAHKKAVVDNDYGDSNYVWGHRRYGRLQRATSTLTRQYGGGHQESVQRTAAFVYDPATLLLTEEIVEPDSTDVKEYLRTVYTLDDFGNRTQTHTCDRYKSSCGTPFLSFRATLYEVNRFSRVEYDPYGRFVERSYNAYDQVVSEVLTRNALYQPTEVLDETGNPTYYEYTANGRQSASINTVGVRAESVLDRCGDGPYCPIGVAGASIETTRVMAGNVQVAPTQWIVRDKLGREVAAYADRFDGLATERPTVLTEYDLYSRVKRKSDPHFEYDGTEDERPWTTTEYDVLGRLVRTVAPDGSESSATYNGLEVTFFNASDQTKVQQKNLLGELVAVTDNLGNTIAYDYNVDGQLTTLYRTNGEEPQTINTYDRLGRKVFMWDADKSPGDPAETGWSYSYNAMGELVSSEDARGYESENTYDELGRLKRKVDRSDTGYSLSDAGYLYQNSISQYHNSTRLQLVQNSRPQKNDHWYLYDEFGRLIRHKYDFSWDSYEETNEFDDYGRATVTRDVTGKGLLNKYTSNGYIYAIADADSPNYEFQHIDLKDARGNVTQETAANGVVTTRTYYPDTGRLEELESQLENTNIQRMHYFWDALGNLTWRHETSAGRDLYESFEYDDLNRLRFVKDATGVATLEVRYDHEGNILYKSDVGQLGYSQAECDGIAAGPHAVTNTTGGITYCYDENGNQVSGNGRTMTYNNSHNLPGIIEAEDRSHFTEFFYDSSGKRFRRSDRRAGELSTFTTYLGNVERIVNDDGAVTWRRYLPNAVETDDEIRFLHKDHLGSSSTMTDADGTVVQRYSFDAFGKQRDDSDWASAYWSDWTNLPTEMPLLSPFSNFTSRGFTGHEHIDEFGLIHMNGRVYDPHLGRFLQADPLIQDATYSQSLNRYSYVFNNPLSYTDPSGFMTISEFTKTYGRMMVAIAICAAAPYIFPALAAASPALFGAVTGAISGYVSTGTFNGALIGAFSGAAFGAMHNWKPLAKTLDGGKKVMTAGGKALKTFTHATAGGISTVMGGGKFMHGFLSAGMSQGMEVTGIYKAMGLTTDGGLGKKFQNAAVAGALGGTVSQLSGGNFANGALTAAYSRLLNDSLETYEDVADVRDKATLLAQGLETARTSNKIPKWMRDKLNAAIANNNVAQVRRIMKSKTVRRIVGPVPLLDNVISFEAGVEQFQQSEGYNKAAGLLRMWGSSPDPSGVFVGFWVGVADLATWPAEAVLEHIYSTPTNKPPSLLTRQLIWSNNEFGRMPEDFCLDSSCLKGQ